MKEIKVMLIDDEKAVRSIIRKMVPWERYHMVVAGEAASGAEALNTMETVEPDIVFVDIKMPFMDGIEFSRIALRQNPDLLVVMLTAYEEFELIRECLRIGVKDYFLKPVNLEEVQEKLKVLEDEVRERRVKEKKYLTIPAEAENQVIQQIQGYIYQNYQNKELNVASIAQLFGFNQSYLGRIYKKETGELLIDTVIRVRMEAAMKLAESGMKMYQTAIHVGMPDSNYFGKRFKNFTGMSYSSYQSWRMGKDIKKK